MARPSGWQMDTPTPWSAGGGIVAIPGLSPRHTRGYNTRERRRLNPDEKESRITRMATSPERLPS